MSDCLRISAIVELARRNRIVHRGGSGTWPTLPVTTAESRLAWAMGSWLCPQADVRCDSSFGGACPR